MKPNCDNCKYNSICEKEEKKTMHVCLDWELIQEFNSKSVLRRIRVQKNENK